MQSTNSAKSLASEPQVVMLAEEEVPDPPTPAMTMTPTLVTGTASPTMTPSTPTGTPQTQTARPSLLPVFQALALVLGGRLMALLLLLSDIALGFLVISDPVPLRLIAGAGYAMFSLATFWILPKK
jgi:hypothetical protein